MRRARKQFPWNDTVSQQQPPHRYFVNAYVDFLFIGGLSIIAYFVIRHFGIQDRSYWVYTLSGGLVWIGNWPHFSATIYRLYRSRENVKQYPLTATLVPIVVFGGMIASFFSPNVVAPYFVKFFLIWSPYHFSGQTIGITLIYARRNGFVFTKLQRLALSGFVFGTFLTSSIAAEVSPEGNQYYSIHYPGFGLPYWLYQSSIYVIWASGIVLVGSIVLHCVKTRRFLHPMILLPATAQYFWFVAGRSIPAFTEFVPFFHSIQYLLIAWSMEIVERREQQKAAVNGAFFYKTSARWGLLNVAGGAGLFFLMPRFFAALGTPLDFSLGVVLAAIQIHHFFVDGVIWKLRRTSVSSPLMENVPSLYAKALQPAN